MKLACLSLLAIAFSVTADPILRAPVNTPTLIQSSIVNPRFAPCIEAQGNYDGAPVVASDCGNFHSENATWIVVNGGAPETGGVGPNTQIKVFGNKCLDVPDGGDWDGNKLQIWTCYDGNPNQIWHVDADQTIRWSSHNKCVDLTDGRWPGRLQIWTCTSPNINQAWMFYPPR
ncbi:ricin B-like lectin [Serendipita vermifera]|nr:ricin B-like lectin [Serendipita vermifera]